MFVLPGFGVLGKVVHGGGFYPGDDQDYFHYPINDPGHEWYRFGTAEFNRREWKMHEENKTIPIDRERVKEKYKPIDLKYGGYIVCVNCGLCAEKKKNSMDIYTNQPIYLSCGNLIAKDVLE